jgi:vomeronasal1 receptor
MLEIWVRYSKCIGFCCFLLWILHLLLNIIAPLNITQSLPRKKYKCDEMNFWLLLCLHSRSSFDTTLGLMVWTKWLHGSCSAQAQTASPTPSHHHSPRPAHEARATNTILILVTSFILFYSLSSVLTFCSCFVDLGQWLVFTSVLVSSYFPTFSSIVLISTDSQISQFCLSCT